MWRSAVPVFIVILGAGCGLGGGEPPPANAPVKADLVKTTGLQLVAELKGPKTVTAGSAPLVEVALVNTSKTVTYRVVPADSAIDSETREPHVTWVGTVASRDGHQGLNVEPRQSQLGCALCQATSDAEWPGKAVALRPGVRLVQDIPHAFEFQRAGRVRLQVRYEYRGISPDHETRFRPDELAFLRGVNPFELVSNAVEFDVVRPLDVRVRARRKARVNEEIRLSTLLDVRLVNQSDAYVRYTPPGEGRLTRVTLEWKRDRFPSGVGLTQPPTGGKTRGLQSGAEIVLLGPGSNGIDGTWSHPEKGRVWFRAGYLQCADDEDLYLHVKSEWTAVEVEE